MAVVVVASPHEYIVSMVTTPLLNIDRQGLTVRLGGTDVRLVVWWQPGTRAWYATAEIPVGTLIVSGRRLAVDAPLLPRPVPALPGNIHLRSTGADAVPAGRAPWGSTHILRYEP